MATGQTTAVVTLAPTADVVFYRIRGFTITQGPAGRQEARARVDIVLPCPQWTGTVGEPGCRCAWEAVAHLAVTTVDYLAPDLQQSQSYCWRIQPLPPMLAVSNVVCK